MSDLAALGESIRSALGAAVSDVALVRGELTVGFIYEWKKGALEWE